ncbi:FTR1 family protein [Cohnella faecalis]|uniref:Iron permease FTR1 family protein n=1 Tax=Cohnella faecalis TaxID=2315694 RepID=A0A398CVH3_9BACL|nr:FTR1 family protein [Cohnella faecalis]RIE03004.1 iron permease FTR1 family protein [Cohnella faecalis]
MKQTSRRTASAILLAVCVVLLTGTLFFFGPPSTSAAENDENISAVLIHSEQLQVSLESGQLEQAAEAFAPIKKWWNANKQAVKKNSLDMSSEIDRQIAAISLSLLTEDGAQALEQAGTLRFSLINYRDGAYLDNSGKQGMTLGVYVMKLRQAGNLMDAEKWSEARAQVKQLQQQWLSVEGDIVSQSQTVYNNSERDLVLLDAYLSSESKRTQAKPIVDRMIDSLTPFIDAQYSWWDAALIPIREGIEALLVVGALLMYAKKADSKPARKWVIGGSLSGVIVCIAVGFAVAVLFSSSAFGHNNSLINGWTGVLASVLLLYVSYWLHRNADTKRWKLFMETKSRQALSGGRMVSLALLAFFAIVREGLETVIFLIGMVGKMSAGELSGGIAAGFGVLALCAIVMVKAGTRLPVRPVFLVSSVIVFYLCFKFMGSGIHSLQMAGLLPSTVHDYLPEYASVSLYPSWYSTLPQLLFVLAALAVIVLQRTKVKRRSTILSNNKAPDAI